MCYSDAIEDNQTPQFSVGSAFEQAYEDLIALARAHFQSQSSSHTLQPTALVNEAFLKIANSRNESPESHEHLIAIASQAMRHVLVDHARKKQSLKRGGNGGARLTLTNVDSGDVQWDILELNDALVRLKELEPRQAEIVELRFFGGLTVEQVAKILNVSDRTVYLDWQMSKAWLWAELRQGKAWRTSDTPKYARSFIRCAILPEVSSSINSTCSAPMTNQQRRKSSDYSTRSTIRTHSANRSPIHLTSM